MTAQRLRRAVTGVAVGIGLAYAVLLAGLYSAQGSLIYPAPLQFAPVPEGYQRITFQTADGLTLTALFRPAERGRRTVVFFHGNGDGWDGAAAANRLIAQAGYGVLLAEYRGYGANPGTPGEQGFYADGRAALAWLAQHGVAARDAVIVGNSIGSGTAVQLATEQPTAGLILISGFTRLSDVAAAKLPWVPARLLLRDRYDNRAKLGQIKAPILLLHGAADRLIPVAQARQLQAANPAARLVIVPGFGHELAYQPAAQQIELEWLDRL